MNSPWLDVPLADYEGHMALPGIEQAQLLSDIFSGVLEQYSPRSVAVIGCAGGNGFERISSGISRVVGVDLNPQFIAETETRFGGRFILCQPSRVNRSRAAKPRDQPNRSPASLARRPLAAA
jgi:hypothetical protein